MWWRYPHNPHAYDDDWEDQPFQGPFFQWGLGCLLPLLLAGYGVCVIATRHVVFGGQISMMLHGRNAIAFGSAWICAAVFLHSHYFWGNIYNQAWFAVLGRSSPPAASSPVSRSCSCEMACWGSDNESSCAGAQPLLDSG